MTNRALATKYARTVFDAVPDADRQRIADNLDAFAVLMKEHADLASVFANPAVPFDRKAAIATKVATDGGAHPTVATLVGLLGSHDQLGALPEVARAFRLRLNTHLRIVEATVTTAVALTGGQAEALQRGLSDATGKQVRLTAAVDPAILGGVVAQIGSTVYDGSVSRQLARMRAQLSREA